MMGILKCFMLWMGKEGKDPNTVTKMPYDVQDSCRLIQM